VFFITSMLTTAMKYTKLKLEIYKMTKDPFQYTQTSGKQSNRNSIKMLSMSNFFLQTNHNDNLLLGPLSCLKIARNCMV
jgi:hypothetical protein